MKTIEGIYNNGQIKLLNKPQFKGQFRVLVQFMKFPILTKTRQKKDPIEDFKELAKKISKTNRNTISQKQSKNVLSNWQKTGKKMGNVSLTDFVIQDRERH